MSRRSHFSRLRGRPSSPWIFAASVFGLLSVGCADDPPPHGAISSSDAPPALPLPVLREGPDIPVDVRLARLLPEGYVDTERVCDLEVVGLVTDVSLGARSRYSIPVATRSTVRCRAATGGGWADLVYSAESAPLSASVLVERRIRARIIAGRGGFDDYPVIEFVALLGESPPAPPRTGALATVPSGFDFTSFAEEVADVGSVRACAVSHVGLVDPIPEDDRDRYPHGASHRMMVGCRHSAGDGWIELLFAPESLLGSLRVLRGRVLPVRLESLEAGTTGHPLASYVSG